MVHASLFSGIGGFDLAAESMGWENAFHCEIDAFCRQVLKYHFPKSKSYENIKETDFKDWYGKIDVLTGGFPCQPFSVAGQRRGTEDNRYLWPEILRAIQEIKPRWIVGENVSGIINWSDGLAFEQVCTDLENEGYEVQPVVLPAISVNAPHRRDRVWFIAKNANEDGWRGDVRQKESDIWKFRNISTGNNEWLQTNNGKIGTTSNSNSIRNIQSCENNKAELTDKNGKEKRTASHFHCKRFPIGVQDKLKSIRRTKETSARREPTRTYSKRNWNEFPTQPPVCFGDDGLSSQLDGITFPSWRNNSIKAAGNAIVPQVALQIFKTIQDYETKTPTKSFGICS